MTSLALYLALQHTLTITECAPVQFPQVAHVYAQGERQVIVYRVPCKGA